MKITKAFFMMILALSFAACKKENVTTFSDGIIGTWELIEYTYTGTSIAASGGQSYTTNFEGEARDITASVEFKVDSTYLSGGSFIIDLMFDVGGQSFNQPYTITNFIGNGTYTIKGDVMTITNDQDNMENTITNTKLEGDELELDLTLNRVQAQGGVVNISELDSNSTLKRK